MIDIESVSTFGELIDALLKNKHATIKQLMDVFSCQRPMVYKYRKGGSIPASPEKLQRFAKQFGYEYTDVLKLAHGRDSGPPGQTYTVGTQQAALIGKMYETLPDDLKASVYGLLVSLSRDSRKTG